MADKYQLKAILSAVDNMSPALKKISQVARSTRKYLLDVGNASGKLASSIGLPFSVLAGATGGLSVLAIKKAIGGYTEWAETIVNSSLKTGLQTEELRRLAYVAERSAVPLEALIGSTAKLNKNIGDAATGKNAELAGLFNHLGIKMRDSSGHMRTAADMLPQLSAAFVRNTNAVTQARMGTALYGKSWQEILPLLMEGPDNIKATGEQFKQLASSFSPADLKSAKEFGDRLKDLPFLTQQLSFTVAKQLLPALSPMLEGLIKWATANKDLLATKLTRAISELAQGIANFDWSGFIGGIRSIVTGMGWMVDKVGGVKNALIGMAIVMNANAIMATMGLVGALSRMVYWLGASAIGLDVVKGKFILTGGWISTAASMIASSFTALSVAAWPITLAVAALALGALYLVKNWDVVGPAIMAAIQPVTESLKDLWSSVKFAFGTLMESISGLIEMLAPVLLPILKAVAFIVGSLLVTGVWILCGAINFLVNSLKFVVDVFGTLFDVIRKISAISIPDWFKSFGGNDSVMTVAMQNAPQQPGSRGAPWAPIAASQARVGGAIDINFNNAPPGMRIGQNNASGPIDFNLSAGYRSAALGMP